MSESLLYQLRPEATVLSPNRATVLSFDREGRLISYFNNGLTYKRNLSSEFYSYHREQNLRKRRKLTQTESEDLFKEIYEIVNFIKMPSELCFRVEKEVLQWTSERFFAEKDRFISAYSWPISILPPDNYLSIVLQASFGCTWNKCTFCNFYQDRSFAIRTLPDFENHIHNVKNLFGNGLSMRKEVFLADGNALSISKNHLLPLLLKIKEHFPNKFIHSFVDVFTGQKHSSRDWIELKDAGLKRIYIGVETGFDRLLNFLNKPGSQKESIDFVTDLKKNGLSVGLILMVGVGGLEFSAQHYKESLSMLTKMPLDSEDIVYLSPFVEHSNSLYSEKMVQNSYTAFDEHILAMEMRKFAENIRKFNIKTSLYSIKEFIY